MVKRLEPISKIVCLALGAFLLYQLSSIVIRKDPLAGVNLTSLSSMAISTNVPSSGNVKNVAPNTKPSTETNRATAAIASSDSPTKSLASLSSNVKQTNAMKSQALDKSETNGVALVKPGSPGSSKTNVSTNSTATNAQAAISRQSGTIQPVPWSEPNPMMSRMGPGMMPGMGPAAAPELPPAIRTRIDRIYQSEMFGPIIRPQPAALVGIAGKDAFLRAPNGQTGLLRVGEELGGIKLLRIGTNRVLVEEDGQQKELMVFSGFGGESLLLKGKEQPR